MKVLHSYHAAIVAIVLSIVFSGSAFLFAKWAFAELTVSQVIFFRFLSASLVMIPYVLFRRAWIRPADIPLFLMTGFLSVPVVFLLQFSGLALTSVTNASLIIGAFPPLLALGATWFYHEKLGWRGWGSLIVSMLGVVVVVGTPSPDHSWLGDSLVFLSLIAAVGWVLLTKRLMERYSALVTTAYIMAFGTAMLLPISLIWDGPIPFTLSTEVWGSLLALGVLCTAFNHALWNWGLERVPAYLGGAYTNLEPLVGALLGVLVLGEPLTWGAVAGGLLILVSAVAIS